MGIPLDAETVKLIGATQTYFAAMYAVALWDWIISLPKEYRRIYKAPISLIKVLYYFNRYYTLGEMILVLYVRQDAPRIISGEVLTALAGSGYNRSMKGFNSNMTQAECDSFHMWEPGVAAFTTIFAEAILVIRTYALWGKNKYILAFLLFGFTLECIVLLFAVTQFKPVPTRDPNDPTSRGACIAGGGPGGHDWTMAYWVSPIAMDTVMLILTSIRALQYRKRGVNSSVFQIFIRDGILYFAVVFVVNLVNTIFYALPNPALQAVNSPMSLLMTSIMCSHIVLSLRGEEKEAIEGVSKDWQINTFLRKKREGTTANGSEKRSTILSFTGGTCLPDGRDISLGALVTKADSECPYVLNGHIDPNGINSIEAQREAEYKGVSVDVEMGVTMDLKKSQNTVPANRSSYSPPNA